MVVAAVIAVVAVVEEGNHAEAGALIDLRPAADRMPARTKAVKRLRDHA